MTSVVILSHKKFTSPARGRFTIKDIIIFELCTSFTFIATLAMLTICYTKLAVCNLPWIFFNFMNKERNSVAHIP